MSNGKGSIRRPRKVPLITYETNWENIFNHVQTKAEVKGSEAKSKIKQVIIFKLDKAGQVKAEGGVC